MRFILLIATFFFTQFSTPKAEHEFHVGIVQMEYSKESKTYQLSLKLFTDDLEKAIYTSTGQKLYLGSDKELPNADELIFAYIQNRFALLDHKKRPLTLVNIGWEMDMDLTWVYLESEKTKPIDGIGVKTDIFFEIFSDQTFLVHFQKDNKTRSLLLHSGKKQDHFKE